jgi:hypothetical protein
MFFVALKAQIKLKAIKARVEKTGKRIAPVMAMK